MFEKFMKDHISKEMIEKFIGCNADAFTEKDLIKLGRVFNSLKDGMSKREDYFEIKLTGDTGNESKAEQAFKKQGGETDGPAPVNPTE
jgi:hypothetical protein